MNLITGRIYKPERLLYYIQPTVEEIEAFYKGSIPEALKSFDGAFGTYDTVGLFKLNVKNIHMDVLGIEFRTDDERVSYPNNLPFVRLDGCFMISAMFTESVDINDKILMERVAYVKAQMNANIFHGTMIHIDDNPDIVQVFTSNHKNRFYIKVEDITKEDFFDAPVPVTESENYLYCAAYKDFITGHYNWNYIWPIIAAYGLIGIKDYAFVHFDIKDFNAINVVYGHEVANKVLCNVVKKMNSTDWIYHSARCHNDNFAMMIKDMPEEVMKTKLLEFFSGISSIEEDPNYHVYYRAGVVPMKNALLLGDRVADAGKQVQRTGNKQYETEVLFYTDSMHDNLDWAMNIKVYLDTAIANDEFLVYLQPKYDINTEKLCGAEALIRWKFHGKDLLPPGLFIPIVETGGLINKLDDIVLGKVCENLKRWKSEGLPLFPISVNLSRKRMGDPNLVEQLTSIVDKYGVDHSLIDFELTESAAYDNQDYMINVIRQLKERNFKISMDDFGTGYSSLSLLTVMPMDTIKIDKSFVDGILLENNQKECTVIKHIITMAKELGFKCLAEGAEEQYQVEQLREFGCEVIQGYYYSKPLPVSEYELKLIRNA